MPAKTLQIESHLMPAKGREARTQSIATRFTPAEKQALLKRAEANEQNLREWARDVLLRAKTEGRKSEMEMHIFTELVGIQMLLMACFAPLLQGQPITAEEYQELIRRAQSGKAKRAKELLAQRMGQEEK